MVPLSFENDGWLAQKLIADELSDMETTSSVDGGKEIVPDTAFIAPSPASTSTDSEKVVPT